MTSQALSELEASDRENFVEGRQRAAPKDLFLPEEFRELARTWEPEQLAIVAIIATRAYSNGLAGGLGNVPPRAGRL
jgi:hypothetical protein